MVKKHSDDEFSIDFSKIGSWFKKVSTLNVKNKAWLTVLLILIPIFFSIFFRAYPYYLPATDDWAYNSIYNNIQHQLSSEINKEYPNLPVANKNLLINQRMSEFLSSNQETIDAQAKSMSQNIKSSFQNDNGQTYMLAIDPYFYYRFTENLVETGQYGEIGRAHV